jgi:hypothetical protein
MKGEHGYNASTTYSGCAAGYAGADCQTDIDECLATPCQNSGVCATPNPNSFTCACTAGFGGPTCETVIPLACVCEYGTPSVGAACPSTADDNNQHHCSACQATGWPKLQPITSENTCIRAVCTCQNGVANNDYYGCTTDAQGVGAELCTSCDDGYTIPSGQSDCRPIPVVIPATFDGWVRRRPLDTADNSYYRMADGTRSYGHSAFPYARCSTNSHTHWCGQSCSESSGNWCSGHDLGGGETVGGSPNCRRSDECRNMQAIQPDSMGSGLTCRRHGWATQDDDSSTEYVIGADGCANKITLGSFNDQAMGLRGYSIQFGQACTGSVTFTFKCNGGPTDQHTVDCGTTKNFFSVYDGRQVTDCSVNCSVLLSSSSSLSLSPSPSLSPPYPSCSPSLLTNYFSCTVHGLRVRQRSWGMCYRKFACRNTRGRVRVVECAG